MATRSRSTWEPDWAIAPGEVLLEAVQDRNMTQSELAHRLGRPLKTVNEIIKGKAAITPETAIQLELALGISARFWTNLETQYRTSLAREQATAALEIQAAWSDRFPISDLIKHKLIERGPTKAATLANLLSWLGVSSPAAFDRYNASAAYRASPAFTANPEAVAAWLRWGEIEASSIEAGAYDASGFREVLRKVRPMTRLEPFGKVFQRIQAMCAEVGVIVVLTPELSGTHLSGATRWIGGRAVVQLSLRYKSDDQFWFSLFHEAGHVLSAGRRREFVDGAGAGTADTDGEERKADNFARDTLLPPDDYAHFLERDDFSKAAVRAFAKAQSIAPGIVAGRLERDGRVGQASLRPLKKPLSFPQSSH